jgi:mannose-1-phosphate guanylyltransferase
VFDEMIVAPQYCVDRNGVTNYVGDEDARRRWGDARAC